MQVLIAEDDRSLAAALSKQLTRSGHTATHVTRGSDVLLGHADADLLLLDLGLEDGEGFSVIRQLRLVNDLPIIVITARGDERSTVLALRLGADDYLVKPMRLRELLARIEVVSRRRQPSEERPAVRAGEVEIDLSAHRVLVRGEEVPFTPKEFALLAFLGQRLGIAVNREQLLDEIWGDAFAAKSRAFDVHLAAVRQKLSGAATITTIRGFGYRLDP